MASLSSKIKEYAKANGVSEIDFMSDVMLQDDMVGGVSNPYIKEWNLDIEKPTDEQLELYETVADTAESNANVDATRRNAYGSWNEQLDEIYHDIDAWKARIAKVKSDNPKE
jgi:exosome complex RNA-binding protein Rrp4